jgi:formylglycine-generating enzyme required for sulfatase activity
LLSESEWEYVARAGTTTASFWGTIDDGIGVSEACLFSNTHDIANKKVNTGYNWLAHPCDDGFAHTAPVGTFKPNRFGLYDMLGNVREWVEDCYGMYVDAPADGSSATFSGCEQRIARGGGCLDGPTWVRSAYRDPHPPGYTNYSVGFRVAPDLP